MGSRSVKAYVLRMAVMLFAGFTMCSSVWAQHAPNSSFDVCTGYGGYINVQGWAYDQDIPDKSISIRVDIYTNSSCYDLYKSVTIKANFYRSDLGAARGFRKNIDINDAGDYWVKVTALDETGDANTVRGPKTATVTAFNTVTSSSTSMSAGTWKVTEDVTIKNRITVSGDVTLWLSDGTTLTSEKGITVADGNKLTIDGTGSLVATGETQSAAIGGNRNAAFGEIVINNGHITATGGAAGAAIGGGRNNIVTSNSKITINGGVITAISSGESATAIGGGHASSNSTYLEEGTGSLDDTRGLGGTITINGGQVTAICKLSDEERISRTGYAIGRGTYATGTEGSSVQLGWTETTDFIRATRLDPNNLSIQSGRAFVIDGADATTANLALMSNGTVWPKLKTLEAATVSGLSEAFTFRDEDIPLNYTVTDAFGNVLTEDVDFTAALTLNDAPAAAVNAVGNYTLTLTGTGDYTGTRSFGIEVEELLPPVTYQTVFSQNFEAIRQTAYSATTATLEWTDENRDVTEWKLEYSTDFHFDPAKAPITELTVSGQPTVTITGLTPETTYYARVKSVYRGTESIWGGAWESDGSSDHYHGSTMFETTANVWVGYGKDELYLAGEEGAYIPYPCGSIQWESDENLTQQLYTAEEIHEKGYINRIAFRMGLSDVTYRRWDFEEMYYGVEKLNYFISLYQTVKLDIYLVLTDMTSFSSGEGVAYTDADCVFSGYYTGTPDSWNYFTLNAPFYYDGSKNLVVIVHNNDIDSKQPECRYYSFSVDKSQSIRNGAILDRYGYPYKNAIRFDITSIDLADQSDNGSAIAANDGQSTGVTLTDRTLYRDGNWNTLCLPFDIDDLDGTVLEDATVMELNSATSSLSGEGVLTLNFTDASSIEAGKPYIVKWNPNTYTTDIYHRRVINNAADWDAFAADVNAGNTQQNVVLAANISVSTMVGTNSNKYAGTFDGNGYTLTFTKGTDVSPYSEGNNCAPFQYINGATIRNLHVTGSIHTNRAEAGGLIGSASGNCTIEHCHVSTIISAYKADTGIGVVASSSGIIGHVDSDNINITDCLFDGQLVGSEIGSFGGFVGHWGPNVTISRCLFDPTTVDVLEYHSATFIVLDGATISNCYYTQSLGLPQGTDASGMSANALASALGSAWTVSGGKAVPILTSNYNYLDLVNPTFGPYQIEGDAPSAVEFEGGKFIGTYSPFADTSARLIGNRNEGNRGFRAAISLDGYTVDWYLNEERTIPATTIPFDPNTGQVVLYLDKTKNTAELEALNSGSSVEDLETNWANKTVEVSFTRSFTQNVASTICLPYPMTEIPAGGSVYEFVDVQKEAGVWVATMRDATPANKVNSTVAGKPYLFMPSATGEVIFTGSVEVPENVTAGSSTSDANDGTWTFRGTYRRLSYKADGTADLDGSVFGFASSTKEVDGNIVNAGEFVKAKDGAGVPAFRAYLTYDGTNNSFRAPARGSVTDSGPEIPDRITVRLLGKDGTITAVGTMNTATGDVNIEQWFDMQGRPVDGTPAVPGMYINNSGSKMLIK